MDDKIDWNAWNRAGFSLWMMFLTIGFLAGSCLLGGETVHQSICGAASLICALLIQVIYAVYRLVYAVQDLGEPRQTYRPRQQEVPSLVAPSPILREEPPKFAVVVPPPVQAARRAPWVPQSLGGVVGLAMLVVVLGVSLVGIVTYSLAYAAIRQPTEPDNGWSQVEHGYRIEALARKMSSEGFVWRTETTGDEDVKNNPAAWKGEGEILNIAWPRWKWKLIQKAKSGPGTVEPPQITLGAEVEGRLPMDLFREVLGETGRFEAELPDGTKEALSRLTEYAQELYLEDHVGTPQPPGARKKTAQISVRRRSGPQKYDLVVTDRVGRYQAVVAIAEYPENHVVTVSLRQPEER